MEDRMNDPQSADMPAQGPAPAGEPAADPVTELTTALALAEQQAAQHRDSYLRAVAELDNQRKRNLRDIENAHKFGLERLLSDLLPVKDSLEMGLTILGDKPETQAQRLGVELTLKLLASVLERYGVTEVNPAPGAAFNPEWHEAMAAQETTQVPADAILQTVQRGYLLNGRLLRPARVLVAKAPAVVRDGSDTA
jgi:molecular chaperone GrpE